jgi:hypothetical protein
MTAIGVIHTSYFRAKGTPIQSAVAGNALRNHGFLKNGGNQFIVEFPYFQLHQPQCVVSAMSRIHDIILKIVLVCNAKMS